MGVRVAIIGAGGMAEYHRAGFAKAGADVVAICDTNRDKAASYAAVHGIPNVFDSIDSLLESNVDFDAVSVITPNKFHCPITLKALENGKHAYVEKPPALNPEEMLQMKEVAEKNDRVLMFDFNNRARPEALAISRYIKDGTVGKINSAEACWIRRSGIPGFGGWFTNKAISGGGAVMDLPHMTDLALYFMGYPEPDVVLARTFDDFMGNPAFKGPWGNPDIEGAVCNVETACHAFVTFKNGACLSIRSSWAEMNEREVVSVTFQGTKAGGCVERLFDIDGLDETSHDKALLFTCEHGLQVNRTIIAEKDESMGRIANASNFIRAVEGIEKPMNTPSEALILMRILDAVYRSSESGKPVVF